VVTLRARGAALALSIAAAGSAPAQQAAYPAKPVRYVVHASAGSGADVLARIVGTELAQNLRQQFVVENRAGAAGNIAAEVAAKSAPDGYTLFQVTLTHAINANLYPNLPYDLVRDFAPVTRLASNPSMVAVHPSLPARSVAELVRLAKARPGAINYASAGTGTITFLAVELLKSRTGTDMLHVPYRGGGEALTSLVSGETSLYLPPIAAALPLMRQGRLRALAVTAAVRMPIAPELPAVAETVPGYEFAVWYGLAVPAKTPRQTVSTIRDAVATAVKAPAVAARLAELGYLVVVDQPDEFGAYIRAQVAEMGRLVAQHRLKPE